MKIIICHEVGHHLDKDIVFLRKMTAGIYDNFLKGITETLDINEYWKPIEHRELNAWEIGMQFVPDHLRYQYENMNKVGLLKRYYETIIDVNDKNFLRQKARLNEQLRDQSEEIVVLNEMVTQLIESEKINDK